MKKENEGVEDLINQFFQENPEALSLIQPQEDGHLFFQRIKRRFISFW